MRLIDADFLVENIGKIVPSTDYYEFASQICNEIRNQPTAYSIEKVVESLKNHPNVFQEFKGCYIPLENAVEVVESNDGKGWWNE